MLDTGRIPLTGEALTWYRQGLACATSGEFEKAVALYNQVIHARSDFWEAWYERGLVLEELGLYAETIASYDRALVLEPPSEAMVEIWFHRASALQYGIGDHEAAMQGYEYVLQLKPIHAQAWHHRGNILLYDLARPEAALVSYDKSLHYQSDHAPTWRNRGNALTELERYAEALSSYDRALAINPQDQIAIQGRQLAAQHCNLRDYNEITTQTCWYGQGFGEVSVEDFLAQARPRPTRLSAFEIPVTAVQPMMTVEDSSGTREVALYQKQYTIGRDPRNDICLKSQFASRFHAVLRRIERSDGSYGYRIQDGDEAGKPSTNGLQVNGKRADQQDLRSGDVVTFGPKTTATFWMPS
jgi:tetratricopeptide (TPR) repeat protein